MFLKTILPAALLALSVPTFGQTLIEKADKQYELHAYRLAAKSYESILSQNADQWAASLRLADCYLHLNDLDKAAIQYAKAVRDGHAQAKDYLSYGRVLMMLGRYEDAEQQFKVYQKTNSVVAMQFIKACEYARSNNEEPSAYEVTPLSKINTTAAEFGATIWKNNLIWSSTRTDLRRTQNDNQKSDLINGIANQLFIAPIEGVSNKPFKIQFLKSDLKNVFNESHPSYSADGKMVAFTRNNIAEDERITSNGGLEISLFLADVDADGNWLNVRPYPYNSGSTGFPCFAPDNKTLYFTSNRAGGSGGFDLYKAELKGNFWSEPKNLGSTINSQGDEITPFFDGKTLYFASDWHFGFGGYDIFKVENSDIVNLGTGINSSGDDFGFVFDPSVSKGFFVSNRKGTKGKDDIYTATRSGESANLVILENGKPLTDTKVKVLQGNASNLSTLKGGNYLVSLSDHKTMSLEVTKEGFKPKTVKIEPLYTNSSRVVEVVMERAVPTQMSTVPDYSAMITDGSTGEPLEGVVVKMVNQTTNAETELTSDVKGRIRFPMAKNGSYLLTLSKEGFVISQKFLKATDAKSQYLGEFALKPSALSGREMTQETTTQPTQIKKDDKKEVKKVDTLKDYSIPVIPSSTKDRKEPQQVKADTKTDEKKEGKKNTPSVFAVQIATLGINDVLSLNKFEDLKKDGNLYSLPENKIKKVRLGVYKTKEEAIAAAKKANTLGFNGAFVVEEKNEQAIAQNIFMPSPQPVKPESDNTTKIQKGTADKGKTVESPTKVTTPTKPKEMPQPYSVALPPKKAPAAEDKTYKVRIAAMKKPEWFDDTKVSKLWKVEKVKEGDLTIFIMDGFKTLEEAKTMKKKVKESGYPDAKVIQKDGTSFKVVD
ncbi:MAG: PD40 domain-containing protein [Saprospiraceae bacterium]|nr:PD40 domain-containing protein [Saprospiraceae bacterium]